jgi:hypothetical protein
MASSFQQKSLLRKIIYIALVVVLFTVTYFLRTAPGVGINARANQLEIREENIGQVDLTQSAVQLITMGTRGFAVCVLWASANEKQKKHEWNELELVVKSVTKLQPHFVTPWLFQSWNLAYNVSMESDLIRDKYFYIAEGIGLLAEGEKLNRNHPDMRFSLGFYNQHKIGISDEANTHRCLYQMSCIDPIERDPNRMRQGNDPNGPVNMVKFEQFCQRHPMLVRRLREALKRESPADVLDFLAENKKIPSIYDERPGSVPSSQATETKMLPWDKRFPILPPEGTIRTYDPADTSTVDFDNFQVARDWYTYSQEPLPPADPIRSLLAPSDYDPRKHRLPKFSINIFRSYPGRGQAYVAEYLEREGWFDKDGWRIAGWFDDEKFQNGEDAVVGKNVDWAARAWTRTNEMYKDYGSRIGIYMEPEEEKSLNDQAEHFRKYFGLSRDTNAAFPAELRGTDYEQSYLAHLRIYWCDRYRQQSNFLYFYAKSKVEADPATVQMRKTVFEADQLRKAGEREQALEKYRAALPVLKNVLLSHDDFRNDQLVQEDSYAIALDARQLFLDLYGKRLRELSLVGNFLGQGALRPAMPIPWIPPAMTVRDLRLEVGTPLDGRDSNGAPIIDIMNKNQARNRAGLPPIGDPEMLTPQPAARPKVSTEKF